MEVGEFREIVSEIERRFSVIEQIKRIVNRVLSGQRGSGAC